MNEFLQKIKEQLQGRSYRHLAREVGLSHSWIAGLLKGKNTLTFETCKKLANWAGIEPVRALEMAGLLPARAVGHE